MTDGFAEKDFEREMALLHAQVDALIANAAYHTNVDPRVRMLYAKNIRQMSQEIRGQVLNGKLSWKQAAELAKETRNTILDVMRGKSTAIGKAAANQLKDTGPNLNTLIAKKTKELFGKSADFNKLSHPEKNMVYEGVVKSAGKSNPRVNALMSKLSFAGKGLVVLSIGMSIYTVATADDKVGAAKREVAVAGAGIGGGIAGGALAGLACGPGAPVCVTIGAFVGGALAAFGVSLFW